jgi:hypothetical protein
LWELRYNALEARGGTGISAASRSEINDGWLGLLNAKSGMSVLVFGMTVVVPVVVLVKSVR